MPRVALDGAPIANSVASNHIYYECWEVVGSDCDTTCDDEGNCYTYCWDVYGWVGYYTSATVVGTCRASSNSVYVNGKNAVLINDRTVENDQYSVPCTYRSGAHSNAQGTVTGGNGRNVFINGRLVSVLGSSVRTHANTNTSINGGTSSNVYIGN